MKVILVMALYLPIAFLGLGLMALVAGCEPPKECDQVMGAVYLLWVVLFGYGGGFLFYVTGIADWMLD